MPLINLYHNVIDISNRTNNQVEDIDYNDLIPFVDSSIEEQPHIQILERRRTERQGMDSLPEEIFNQLLETCFKQGNYKGFRDALLFTTQANWGVRCSDVRIIKRIDFINEYGKFRESCVFPELKTGKPRTMYINDAIKMCVLMVMWSRDIKPLDYLLVGHNYKKKKDPETGKVLKNGKHYAYELDENGEKIPEPLSYPQIMGILDNKLINDLDIQLMNHKDCVNGDSKYATHSLRKLYANKIKELFQEMYGDIGKIHTDAMEFINWDMNHSSMSTTSRYCGDFEAVKKELNMKMNLGLNVIKKYFEIEKEKRLKEVNL